MPLEMPRVAPRRKQHGRHHHAHTAAAAPWTDVEDHAQRNRRGDDDDDDSDESSGYDDDERTQHTDRRGDGDGEDDDGCCAPLAAMTKPVEVGELGSYGYAGEAAFWIWPLFGPLLFENTSSDVRGLWWPRLALAGLDLAGVQSC
ncbi:hypothetical protein SPBR_01107 [Sporothrix brasiliensis 5110]|uniref:Uncharacterized protein n=1 Tax=Sporothrix brasiliensis 5110 TaxID=1398154 RepID=A0A0C2IYX8_9PEZI|nr:uncharacterized protein SPBR_01107 [Sporothrix brasiliensis 5110]KIH90137.1 hypothetical protein SPBR_01107 [Sporothrix brasiliensis 5110]